MILLIFALAILVCINRMAGEEAEYDGDRELWFAILSCVLILLMIYLKWL